MKGKKFIIILAGMLITGILFAQQNQQNQQNQQTQTTNQQAEEQKNPQQLADEAEAKWHNPDYRPYVKAFDQLIRLSKEYAKNKLRLAKSNYQTGLSIIEKMREDVQRFREEAAEAKHFNEKWYWQTIDRKAREERIIAEKKRTAKLKSVTYFTRAIKHLDAIQNKGVRESDLYKELLANVYRMWVITQYDLGNLPQTIDILERYIALDPKYEAEVSPHRYLASAYGFKEAVLLKNHAGSEEEALYYKKKKNEHLLRAAELKYKKDSPEYEQILELVNRDEIIAISP
ncbi:MAG: hypothetical protein D6767_06410 [Candidatus Hydrogenedentota bacterium]|nr:MAG: hypothetical protein D6767_06410 [Candidatus Hydrogenedentota bacterium]